MQGGGHQSQAVLEAHFKVSLGKMNRYDVEVWRLVVAPLHFESLRVFPGAGYCDLRRAAGTGIEANQLLPLGWGAGQFGVAVTPGPQPADDRVRLCANAEHQAHAVGSWGDRQPGHTE